MRIIATLITAILATTLAAPIADATPRHHRKGHTITIVIDPKPTCPKLVKEGRFFRVIPCNPNV